MENNKVDGFFKWPGLDQACNPSVKLLQPCTPRLDPSILLVGQTLFKQGQSLLPLCSDTNSPSTYSDYIDHLKLLNVLCSSSFILPSVLL